jgi:hypothetical protein
MNKHNIFLNGIMKQKIVTWLFWEKMEQVQDKDRNCTCLNIFDFGIIVMLFIIIRLTFLMQTIKL